ncbi:nucleotidyltransferase [Pseudomonas citronellolis]|uniref:nucleotide-binding domain-containing protein n=1 Tax=Pseudomonas citronellolis TaxID=53408 RepID=UPI002647D019|nr:nucleotidyltransferase [Pseudomonas citronellolis]MDN6874484.1 nucleotidyltransferase [Pseudomonas citronellolis]
MSISDKFKSFLENIKITNEEQIGLRYGEITSALNREFRDTDSRTANNLQVGSYGRWTAIQGVSDLDMLYIMPASKWGDYNVKGGQSKLLSDTKTVIKDRYPRTDVYVDSPVVRVLYTNFHVEVQPVFELEDGSFKYPDTSGEGSWKITKPREEISEMTVVNNEKNRNLRRLCKMARAWKNKHGVAMGGLLIDTLAHNFLKSTEYYDDKSYLYYDYMSRDFFYYLSELPEQDYYAALGSGQRVKVKKKFQKVAKKAYELTVDAIAAADKDDENEKWRKVFGRPFPALEVATKAAMEEASSIVRYDDTEQYVENSFPVDVRNDLRIECEVSQHGFREALLREMISRRLRLSVSKKLRFYIDSCAVSKPYDVYWKVLNRGAEAKRRNCVRGRIVPDGGHREIVEHTNFNGDHIVECYIVKNGVVVAKDRIHVPIQ